MAKYEQVVTDGTGAMTEGERLFRARMLFEAAAACHPEDAQMLMTGVLDEMRIGMPRPGLTNTEKQADLWAALATFDEQRAWFIATARQLVQRNLGARGRLRLIERLAEHMSDDERNAVLELFR